MQREYVDHAPANDPGHRTAWRDLMDDAARRRFAVVGVFKLDRAFRSVKHMHDTLDAWEKVRVGFVSAREGFDTRTALGRLLMNLLASPSEGLRFGRSAAAWRCDETDVEQWRSAYVLSARGPPWRFHFPTLFLMRRGTAAVVPVGAREALAVTGPSAPLS